jgi:FtsH-binding integral membrane protein
MIVLFFWGLGNWDMIILSVFGVLFSGIYILIDLLKLMTPEVCSYDDYILGALMLYLDMVRMFIYILRIFAEAKK